MTDMKCPFCGKEMICGGTICRFNPDCPIYDKPVPTEVLELLDRTRKALNVAKDAIDKGEAALIGCQEADDKYISDVTAEDGLELMSKAYKQITALEQKDVK